MKTNNLLLHIVFISFLILVACGETSQVNENRIPQIVGISRQTTYHNAQITVYGKFFGESSDRNFLVFIDPNSKDTLLKIPSQECLKWTGTEIIFKVSNTLASCNLLVHSEGKNSNKIYISISNIPELEMLEIPAGNFPMGSAYGYPDEMPVHDVRITRKFYMSKYEISQLLWENVMNYNNSYIKYKNLPVHNIDWLEAIRFCNEISKRMAYDTCYIFINDELIQFASTADGYRLPTEAEWEYACKAKSSSEFDGYEPEDIAWFNINSGYSPHPSGELRANKFGLHDMQGNVWEWCWDWYSADYYKDSLFTDPIGPAIGSKRVARGGSCESGTAFIRPSNRNYPEQDNRFIGLRLARTKYE